MVKGKYSPAFDNQKHVGFCNGIPDLNVFYFRAIIPI